MPTPRPSFRARSVLVKCLHAACVAAFTAAGAPAQAPVSHLLTPGDSMLRLDHVRLGVDTIVVLVTPRDSTERVALNLIRRLERIQRGGEAIFRETQRYYSSTSNPEYDTLDVAAATLALRRIVEVSGPSINVLSSDGVRLTGRVSINDSIRTPVDIPFEPSFHDMMDEAFIGAYPLDPGVTLRVPVIRPPSVTVRPITFIVEGVETLRTANGPVECLRVRGPGTTTSWIARSDGHMVRLRWMTADSTVVWKLPARDVAFRWPILPRGAKFVPLPHTRLKIMRNDVTVAEYLACANAGACSDSARARDEQHDRCNWKHDRQDHPMNCVRWAEAAIYCTWLGARLPTSVEWTLAASSGDSSRIYPWGNAPPDGKLADYCDVHCPDALGTDGKNLQAWEARGWIDRSHDDGYAATSPVGHYRRGATPWGLFDMAGNVWQWTSTETTAGFRIVRGGSWDNAPASLAIAKVLPWPEAAADAGMGFRCVQP